MEITNAENEQMIKPTVEEKDYKKWILFNNGLSKAQNLYELYIAVSSGKNKGSVSFNEEFGENGVKYLVSQAGYDTSLEIDGEANRKSFLEFLVQHYLPNEDIEEWYQSKLEAKEKSRNFSTTEGSARGFSERRILDDLKIHPKERVYYNFRVLVSISFYLLLFGVIVASFVTSVMAGVSTVLSIVSFVVFFAIARRFAQGFFIGVLKGNTVKITAHQYPEIFKIVADQAKAIGLKDVPAIYVGSGHFNAFVTKLAGRKVLMLYSEVVETAARGDFEVLKFIIGHELGHIKRKHLNNETWLIPSVLIPFLKLAHSRGCEYTCDRIGYHFSVRGANEGILIMATGKEIYSKVNIDRYIEDANGEDSFWVWFSEKFLTHPHTYKRLTAIRTYSQRGY